MPLKIRYENGPYAGRDIDIEDDRDEVRFGRGLDADIPFPDELTIVSRQHFGLRKEYGGYKFIINQEKPVFMNGRPVFDGQDLPRIADIQLSGPEGPRLKVERLDGYGSNQLKTEVLKPVENVASALVKEQKASKLTAGTLAIVALALVIAAGAGYWLLRGTQDQVAATGAVVEQTQAAVTQTQSAIAETQSQIDALKEQIPSLKDQMDALGKSYDFTALIAQTKGSVYQVAVEAPSGTVQAGGTAWVVELADGTRALATNAHVADLFFAARTPDWGEGRLIAIEPKAPDYRRFVITGIRKHPAYDAWNEFAGAFFAKSNAGTVRSVALPVGYDVAIMTVDDPSKLGKPLKIAPRDALESMSAGERLLQIGYPSENVLGTDVMRPEPSSQTGLITAMTSFFLSAGAASDRQFIQHNAAGAGGSSGSAMFNTNGEVVGLHNSGNYIFIPTGPGENDYERVPSAGNINYAQRADLLAELIDGTADQRLATVYRPMWTAAEQLFSKTPEAIVQDQIAGLGYMVGGRDKVTLWKSLEGDMATADPLLEGYRGVVFDVDPPQGQVYMFLASAADQRNIGVALYKADGTFFGIGTRGSFFSSYFITYDAAMPSKIAVFDDYGGEQGGDTRAPGKIRLDIYTGPIPPP